MTIDLLLRDYALVLASIEVPILPGHDCTPNPPGADKSTEALDERKWTMQ